MRIVIKYKKRTMTHFSKKNKNKNEQKIKLMISFYFIVKQGHCVIIT